VYMYAEHAAGLAGAEQFNQQSMSMLREKFCYCVLIGKVLYIVYGVINSNYLFIYAANLFIAFCTYNIIIYLVYYMYFLFIYVANLFIAFLYYI
jgi:hypothetical protein